MPLSIPGVQKDPVSFLGPNVMSMFIQAIETGIIINQSFTFWSRAERESAVLRTIVISVTLVALFQTSLTFYSNWSAHVLHFGDWAAASSFIWVDKLSPLLTVSMASPVQAFLIWRCWNLTKNSWLALTCLGTVLSASTISSIVVTVQTFHTDFEVLQQSVEKLPKISPDATFILTLTSSAVLDVAVTFILLIYLSRAKANVYSSRFRRILKKLSILIWEAAVPPCVCAILAVVTYLTLVNKNYWNLMFQAILGKLYVISLFVTLNGHADLACEAAGTNDRLTSMAWVTSAPVHINIAQDVESQLNHTNHSPSTPGDSSIVIEEPKTATRVQTR